MGGLGDEKLTPELIKKAVEYAAKPTPGILKGSIFIMVTKEEAKDIGKYSKKWGL